MERAPVSISHRTHTRIPPVLEVVHSAQELGPEMEFLLLTDAEFSYIGVVLVGLLLLRGGKPEAAAGPPTRAFSQTSSTRKAGKP